MKKLIYCAAALAAMIFAGSCQRENLEPVAQDSTVTYSVELPGVQTKAIGDGFNVNQLVYEVWKTENPNERDLNNPDAKATRLYQATAAMTEKDGEQKTVITLNLVHDQNYTILFWAQHVSPEKVTAENASEFYNTEDLTNISYKKEVGKGGYLSSVENMAAFYKAEFLTAEEIEKPGMKRTELTRPFAQLNIGTKNTAEEYKVEMQTSRVVISDVPTVFDVAQNTPADPCVSKLETFVFNYNELPKETLKVNNQDYEYVAMNYIFAGSQNVTVTYDITAELTAKDTGNTTEANVNNVVVEVPLKENYRTNIIGNLLTSETKYEVVIDADFANPDYVLGQEWSQTGNYTYTINEGASAGAFKAVLDHAVAAAKAEATKAEGPVVKIDLAGDVVWETGAGHGSTPLIPVESPISAVVINGNGKTFTATGAGVGPIRLANGGQLTFNNVNVVDKSKSYNENAWELTYLEFGGKLAFNGCTFNSGIQFEEAEVVADKCRFISNEDSVYSVWICGNNATFTECTFEGTRGLKAHEDYGSEVATVVVDGCTFGPLTKKPGIALGTLNAETSVSIINSTFDSCQAGDQNNYAYETDTDTTAFEFTFTNNIVIPSGDGFIKQADDITYIVANATGLKNAIADSKDGDIIKLNSGEYDDLFQVGAKSITITSLKEDNQAVVAGRVSVAGNANSTATFTNLKFEVSDNTHAAFGNTLYDKGQDYIIGIYCGNVTVQGCEFAGMTDDFGAITFHSYASGATTETLEKLVVDGCKFDGGRAIRARSNVSVTNCKFSGLVNPCLQVLGLGNNDIQSTVTFTGNTSDVNISGVCIKTSNYVTKNIAFNVANNTKCNYIAYDGKNLNNLYPDTYTYTGEVKIMSPEDAKALTAALDKGVKDIVLLPGVYKGTFAIKADGTTITGQEGAVVDCINLNGKNNVTLKNITFDAAGAKFGYDGKGTKKDFAFSNIITGDNTNKPNKGAHNLVIDGCTFTGEFANPGAPIAFTDQNRGSGASGNITIKNCVFENTNANYTIYAHYTGDSQNGHGDFVIENNIFNSTCYAGPIYLGRYASNVPVEVTGNEFNTVTSIDYAIYVQDHSSYGVSINASNNTFAE